MHPSTCSDRRPTHTPTHQPTTTNNYSSMHHLPHTGVRCSSEFVHNSCTAKLGANERVASTSRAAGSCKREAGSSLSTCIRHPAALQLCVSSGGGGCVTPRWQLHQAGRCSCPSGAGWLPSHHDHRHLHDGSRPTHPPTPAHLPACLPLPVQPGGGDTGRRQASGGAGRGRRLPQGIMISGRTVWGGTLATMPGEMEIRGCRGGAVARWLAGGEWGPACMRACLRRAACAGGYMQNQHVGGGDWRWGGMKEGS